jgi:hypothetical protein
MYEHILAIDREVYWIYGNVTCAGYPLENIDTISDTGEIDTNSAMYQVVYGVGYGNYLLIRIHAIQLIHQQSKEGHLDMIDGMIGHLLHEKWKTFVRFRWVVPSAILHFLYIFPHFRFFRRFAFFIIYFLIFFIAFYLRPGTDKHVTYRLDTKNSSNGSTYEVNVTVKDPCYLLHVYKNEDIVRINQ